MNREIKFRAWDKKKKKMLDCDCDEFDFISLKMINKLDNLLFMQNTGFKDKNGVEIYEGDIVKTMGHIHTVEFNHGAFIIGYHNGSSTIERPKLIQGNATEKANKVEIIGNIYENPNLIK